MKTPTARASTNPIIFSARFCWVAFLALATIAPPACQAQETDQDSASATLGGDGVDQIVITARSPQPEPPVFYTAIAKANARVGNTRIEQTIELAVEVVQGDAEVLTFGLNGPGEVLKVEGEQLKSWSVRQEGSERFLDLHLKEAATEVNAVVKTRSPRITLPTPVELTHLTPGNSIGFTATVSISYVVGVDGTVTEALGFAPLDTSDSTTRFQSTTGGQLKLSLNRDGAAPRPVELTDTRLVGTVNPSGDSVSFQLRSTVHVTEANARLAILSGNAAVSLIPTHDSYRLRLKMVNGKPAYTLEFSEAGTFPLTLDFVATVSKADANRHVMDFTVAASAVVPLTLKGLDAQLEFHRDQQSVVPVRDVDNWLGFLPASGRALLQWKTARRTGEGKLFFTTTGHTEARVGVGLLRQQHQIDFQVLQGQLNAISILLDGPGEILDVQGSHIVGWKVTGKQEQRQLDITLSQPITTTSQFKIRSQTALGAFPVQVEGMRLSPVGTIRHSGYLRLTNLGSVRLEPTGLTGLTQLSPDQFPGDAIKARQVFVYRFPAADYDFEVVADRIQPEVNISQLVLYELAETDRVIRADVELDIREAPIREWDFKIPADYSVVAVSGAGVADYIAASEATDGQRNLKIMFGQDVSGRQLVQLHLEKNEAAVNGNWTLPRIEYPEAKSVRGNIGVIGAPGFRIAMEETELLVEKPLSYFPKPMPNLQQAFRIREPDWSATVRVELLDRSVQADVFHLYTLSQGTVYGSALINYFVTGAPVSEWTITVPQSLGNVRVDGQDVRTWRRENDNLIVALHQPVMGPYTLLVTFEEKPDENNGTFQAGQIAPTEVQGERGYIQVVSPMQVAIKTESISDDMLKLDPLELPAEFRLLCTAPALGTWQYTERPFELNLNVNWFQPGTTVSQIVEFSEATSRVSPDGELVTDVLYYVKSRGGRTLKIKLPDSPVRLWEVSVGGRPVTARQTDSATLIPLPGNTNPNIPVEVRLRLGKPAVSGSDPVLNLPVVSVPVLKTQWNISGDEHHALVPNGGTVEPSKPVLRPSGFNWVAKRGILPLITTALLMGIGIAIRNRGEFLRLIALIAFGLAICIALATALAATSQSGPPAPLQLSLPVLSADGNVELQVKNVPLWRVNLSWTGLIAILGGLVVIVRSFNEEERATRMWTRGGGLLLVALGILFQRDGAPWFFHLLALSILLLMFLPLAWDAVRGCVDWTRATLARRKEKKQQADPTQAGVTTTLLALATLFLTCLANPCLASLPAGFVAADSIQQQWQITHKDNRLTASGTVTLSGRPGDRFLLLRAPAILTSFDGEGLRLSKRDIPGHGLTYIISIPSDQQVEDAESLESVAVADFQATFQFQLEAINPASGVAVPTGTAAVQEIELSYDEAGWDVLSPTAVRVEPVESAAGTTQAKVLLGTGPATLVLKPKARDLTSEETQFFVEAANLYLPGPGVVDGRHRLHIRTSQGQVNQLNVTVPAGLTVSEVHGPVGSWQFDADSGQLKLEIEPAQSQAFDILVETQRGLDPLPADVTLAPLTVSDANGEVGMVGIAFDPDAQPERVQTENMSAVNLGDFDPSLIPDKQAILHRVYRYGAEGGSLTVRVAPVDSEVRVVSKQVLSLGDERVVLAVNFIADISRAGLFQLSFPLPDGFEVESLTGSALHHWAEHSADDQRRIILHLNGKTIGSQTFSLSLTGNAPTEAGGWQIPRFELSEATRQTGELVVQPTTGIRLRTVSRQNVSEVDPRNLGGKGQGALAFRLLQRDWSLELGVEKLQPWVTGKVLHETTIREGQTRSALIADFNVQNASIRSLLVELPITGEDEIKTLRASGKTVGDFVRTAPDSSIWELQLKRRVVGSMQFRIEYERRGDRENDSETLRPIRFPQARQLNYYCAVRSGGRLEIAYSTLPPGWQQTEWNTVPQPLRDASSRLAPDLVLRAVEPEEDLSIRVERHSLADALKLRVAQGALTTILSPTGDQLTAVDLNMEVIQRSSLSVRLPAGGELFCVFVNEESVHSIRQGGQTNAWQFYILPGIDDRTAKVRFVYSVPGDRLESLKLNSPQLNVPLENIEWNVITPQGFVMNDHDGNLELLRQDQQGEYNRSSYLSKINGQRQAKAQQAAQLLEQANQLLQAGDQKKAGWALNSVANQYALDAASNEDARVQLRNLKTQQAIVGLNTRRQRIYLDNDGTGVTVAENEQLRQAADENPILQRNQMNFQPQQMSQLLRGNTTEDNAVLQQIADRLVQHQHATEPAPQAITISLPEEGTIYTFGRSVQVAENAPLQLDLQFGSPRKLNTWQTIAALASLLGIAAALTLVTIRKPAE